MKISITTKLYLGFAFLFLLIIVLWTSSYYYLFNVTNYSDAMVKDNYNSVVSAKQMTQALNEIEIIQTKYFYSKNNFFDKSLFNEESKKFEKNLVDEENNITEVGEKELAQNLRIKYQHYVDIINKAKTSSGLNKDIYFDEIIPAYNEVDKIILDISNLNMSAIIIKNGELKKTSHIAFNFISVLGTLCFLISISFCLNFPRIVVIPIKEMINGIKEISNKNFDQQLKINSSDEFGEMADAFNEMAKKLDENEHSNLSK